MKKTAKILVVDGQVFQTPAWHRGMGKYSIELISAVCNSNNEVKNWDEIKIILSSRLETEESLLESLSSKAPNVNIVSLNLAPNEYDNRMAADKNRKIMDEYLASSYGSKQGISVDFLVLSLMQSEIAPAFSSLDFVKNHLLVYDLIPLMFHKTYLTNPLNQKSYLSKLCELLKADNYLTISKTVANDLAYVMSIDKSIIASIDGAPIEHAHKPTFIDVPKPFILMPTGNDLRKNNKRGIKAFDKFNKMHKEKYTLVITSSFQQNEVDEYSKLCNKILFTGNISGGELEYLYETTDALFFPTEYEGLGLPILEALEKDKPVACSDISVFKEISDTAFHYFDPQQELEMVKALNRAIKIKTLPLKEYRRVLGKFTWARTAGLLAAAFDSSFKLKNTSKPPISVISPAPQCSLFGVKMQQAYSEMQRRFKVNLLLDSGGPTIDQGFNYLGHISNTTDITYPTSINLQANSLPLYFIDNSVASGAVLLVALANPGVVVLDTPNLTKLWKESIKRGLIHRTRYKLEQELSKRYESPDPIVSLLASQKYLFVQDAQTKAVLQRTAKKLPLGILPQIMALPPLGPDVVYEELEFGISAADYPPSYTYPSNSLPYVDFIDLLIEKDVIHPRGNNV